MKRRWVIGGLIGMAAATLLAGAAAAADLASTWITGHASRVRLVAGSDHADPDRLLAAVQIKLTPGWKTYWRHPGDSGGLPPRLDWSGSENLARAEVLFPAPTRLPDVLGDTLGYKHDVDLPVRITAKDPGQPVLLKLALEFGVCREICVPGEARFELLVPSRPLPVTSTVMAALAKVPRDAAARRPGDPKLVAADATLAGTSPKLSFEIAVPGGAEAADVFVEAPAGIYLGVPKRVEAAGERARFMVDLKGVSDVAHLKGKTLTITITAPSGAVEATWTVEG